MNKKAISTALVIVVAAFWCAAGASAGMEATSYPQETRLVRFVYDQNRSYDILTRPNTTTDIQLAQGEMVVAFALGDTVQWIVDQAPGHIFIKPTRENLFTSATLVTDKRSYQLQFRAMPEDGNWYQRVHWEYPSIVIARKQVEKKAKEEKKRVSDLGAGAVASPDALNFDYEVKGEAPFAPITVFDDGRFTWMKMPDNAQDTPAVFLKNENENRLILVNYVIRGEFLVVQRLADAFVLKTGGHEVLVQKKRIFDFKFPF